MPVSASMLSSSSSSSNNPHAVPLGARPIHKIQDLVDVDANKKAGIVRVENEDELYQVAGRVREEQQGSGEYKCTSCLGLFCCCGICASRHVVPSGHIGLTNWNGRAAMAPPGVVWTPSMFESFEKSVPVNQPGSIVHGKTMTITTIKAGNIGVVENAGNILFLEPGMYFWNSSTCKFLKEVAVNTSPEISLCDPFWIWSIQTRCVGIAQENATGRWAVFESGQYLMDKTRVTCRRTIKTSLVTEEIAEECSTKDNHRLKVVFAVTSQIEDPLLYTQTVDDPKVFLKNTYDGAITQAVAGFLFSDLINTSTNPFLSTGENVTEVVGAGAGIGVAVAGARVDDASALDSFLKSHRMDLQSQCLSKLHDVLIACGMRLKSMNIVDLVVVDENVRTSISNAASSTVRVQAELRNIAVQKTIAKESCDLVEKQALAVAAGVTAKAHNDAEILRIKTAAENDASIKKAKNQAEVLELMSTAEANAEMTRAMAKSKALSDVGTAEADVIRKKIMAETGSWVDAIDRNVSVLNVLVAQKHADGTRNATIVGTPHLSTSSVPLVVDPSTL